MNKRKFQVTNGASGLFGKVGTMVKENDDFIILDMSYGCLIFHKEELEEIN